MSSAPVIDLIPFVRVGDIERSIEFYERLGMEVGARFEHDGWLLWCHLRSGEAQVMLALASEPIHAAHQTIIFYLYTDDLDALREELVAAGGTPGPIEDGSPGPKREMLLEDPDGYVLMVAEGRGP